MQFDADKLSTFGKKSAKQVLDLLIAFLSTIISCPKCGKTLISDGKKFCGNCGEQITL
ncbi:MAG: zinc ribbon domain-containing protein [Candidatus Lokiarchaeota archaeon]|nr:zinc ribbon domain-containing protein [Candidatus Lokiarchaeota archaeon]